LGRGYGRSPEATTWYYEVEDLATLLRRLKVARAAVVGSSHGGSVSMDFSLQYPQMVQQLVLVGAVVSGLPYSDHFLNRGIQNSKPFEKNDVNAGLTNWANDRYLIAPGHDAARKRLLDLLKSNPQDMTHNDYARSAQPALPRLSEIRVPTLILAGDADIPDVHAHAGAIEAGIRGSHRVVLNDVGHLMYLEKPEEFSKIVIGFIHANSN
jgi:3-oxoadipate enol-lactonase